MMYGYQRDICVCGAAEYVLPMRKIDGEMVENYPVIVYNVNGLALGVAENKDQYLRIWNSSNANKLKGVLSGIPGPFSFSLRLRRGQLPPPFVIGDICALIVDADGYCLVDADGFFLGSLCPVVPPVEPPIDLGEFTGEFTPEMITETFL